LIISIKAPPKLILTKNNKYIVIKNIGTPVKLPNINLSSVAGVMGNRGQVNYSATKAGIIGATKSLAIEMSSRGITVHLPEKRPEQLLLLLLLLVQQVWFFLYNTYYVVPTSCSHVKSL
jgi:hypothetical protein